MIIITHPIYSDIVTTAKRVANELTREHSEVTLTRVAEETAWALGHDEWLDDPHHEIWDAAYDAVGSNAQLH